MTSFYSDYIREDDLVFDVGANHGNRTEVFLSLGARVVAFEPQPDCARDLLRRFSKYPNFTLVQKALGKSAGKGVMRLCPADTISSMSDDWITSVKSSGRFSGREWDASLPVDVTTLSHEIIGYGVPSFIKIDVEGYEAHVLKGLDIGIRGLSFEFTPEYFDSTMECVDRLQQLGKY